jgi:hypothetical protein
MSRSRWALVGLSVICALLAVGLGVSLAAKPAVKQPVKDYMSALGSRYKTVAGQIKDAGKNDGTLQLVVEMEEMCVDAKAGDPPKIAKLTGDAKKQAQVEYRKLLNDAIAKLIKVEEALSAGKNDDAAAAWAEVTVAEQAGHKQFK